MDNVKIFSAGSQLGDIEVPTRELVKAAKLDERFGVSPNHIEETTGISHVVHCDSRVKPGDLAYQASAKALASSPVQLKEIDAVFYCGIEGNGTEPSTAHAVAAELGIDAGRLEHCFDVSNACHGFTAGISVARAYIRSGEINNALICTGERSSGKTQVVTDDFLKGRKGKDDVADTLGAFTVGDAGGAMVIGRSEDHTGIVDMLNYNNSKLARLCYYDDFGLDVGIEPEYAMKMARICASTIKVVKRMIPEALQRFEWQVGDVDHAIFHQVGTKVYDAYIKGMAISPSRAISTYQRLGNLASASIPVCWDRLSKNGELEAGQNVFVISTGSGIVVTQLGITL